MMFAKRKCGWLLQQMVPLHLLLSLAVAYPTTTSVPDEPSPPLETGQPLSRGPCAEGEWLVPTDGAAAGPSAQGRCTQKPCPESHVLWEGRCFVRANLETALCGVHPITFGPMGLPVDCRRKKRHQVVVRLGPIECVQRDGGGCAKDVEGPRPLVLGQEAQGPARAVIIKPEE